MSWSNIVGHDHLVALFRHVEEKNRLGHAYLFVGPEGVGKKLFARELAKALLCEAPPTGQTLTACDRCDACLLVKAGTHPDYFEVGRLEDKNELDKDQMQELCANFGLKPARGHGKVAVLDDADDLNDASANCFLKTLEEPPPRSIFILVGGSMDRQLPTILSRCQVVRFGPLKSPQVAEALRRAGVTDATQLVRLSGGSPGQALALAEPELWDFRTTLLQGLRSPKIDSVALAKKLTEFVEDAGKEGALQRQRATLVRKLLVETLADALAVSLGGEPRRTDPHDRQIVQDLASRANPQRLLAVLDRCLDMETHLDRYIQVSLVLEGWMDALGQRLGAN